MKKTISLSDLFSMQPQLEHSRILKVYNGFENQFLCYLDSLWGGSVINLGTKKHKDKYFDGIESMEYTGCFAMTELHHGKFFTSSINAFLSNCVLQNYLS